MNMVVKWDFALLILHKWRAFKLLGILLDLLLRFGLNIIF